MLDSIEFFKLLERCGAIISGFITEQIIHGPFYRTMIQI
jgi:hypothetical protein